MLERQKSSSLTAVEPRFVFVLVPPYVVYRDAEQQASEDKAKHYSSRQPHYQPVFYLVERNSARADSVAKPEM